METWKDIPEFEGRYRASTFGRIESLTRKVNCRGGMRLMKGRILKPGTNAYGYKTVALGGTKTTGLVHRLVAQTFIPNPDNKPQINHKNGIKADNHIDNLEWCTNKENEWHSWNVLGKGKRMNHATGFIPANSKTVTQYSLDDKMIATYQTGVDAAVALGLKPAEVHNVCRGKRITTHGFKFKYGETSNKAVKRTTKHGIPTEP